MKYPRRFLLTVLTAMCVLPHALAAAPAQEVPPPELAALVPPGATLKEVSYPAKSVDVVYRTAGTLPGGNKTMVFFAGTKVFDYRMVGRNDRDETAAQAIFTHYDTQVARAGGKRLNQGFDTTTWLDTYAKLHVFEVPTANGPLRFGLWIQDHGERHWLAVFPSSDARAAPDAKDIEGRLDTFGSAPLYINFDTNKAVLKADGQAAVAQMVAVLKKNAEMKLLVEGHTDNVGTAESNKTLSLARANAVVAAVVAQGIAASRLTTAGRGQEVPLADNGTESGRAKNRRVELVKANK